jgi:general L-amino acid transport system permease protein
MTQEAVAEAEAPRRAFPAAAALWLRKNLFSTWWNALLTALILWALVSLAASIFEWAVVDAVWGATSPDACTVGGGACWAVIYEKYRLILFGLYPYTEQWRPTIAMMLFVALLLATCNRDFWKLWLGAAWVVGVVAIGVLMWGGVLGLTYVENSNWGGLPLTLFLSAVGLVVAFPLGVLLALGRRCDMPVVRMLSVGYIELVRGVPLITVLFMASVMFPLFLPPGVTIDKLLRAQVGLILFAAAYLAEVVRGGLQAIPKGQFEAADSLGLSYWQKMRLIVLPQALRISIPPLVNTFIGFFKDTTLVIIIGLFDLLGAAKLALTDPLWRAYYKEAYIFIGLIYFSFCFFMSRYSQWLEKKVNVGVRRR